MREKTATTKRNRYPPETQTVSNAGKRPTNAMEPKKSTQKTMAVIVCRRFHSPVMRVIMVDAISVHTQNPWPGILSETEIYRQLSTGPLASGLPKIRELA